MQGLKNIEVDLELEEGHIRTAIITEYSYEPGHPGHGVREDCAGCPPEPSTVDDLKAVWKNSGVELTDPDYEVYLDILIESVIADIEGLDNDE